MLFSQNKSNENNQQKRNTSSAITWKETVDGQVIVKRKIVIGLGLL
jgi:hypothetical protein